MVGEVDPSVARPDPVGPSTERPLAVGQRIWFVVEFHGWLAVGLVVLLLAAGVRRHRGIWALLNAVLALVSSGMVGDADAFAVLVGGLGRTLRSVHLVEAVCHTIYIVSGLRSVRWIGVGAFLVRATFLFRWLVVELSGV